MTARNVVSVAAVVAILSTGLVGFSGIAHVPGDQKPQVQSALGKQFFAKADADGAIAKADAARAADPDNLDLLIAAARAHDVALQFDASIPMYTKAIGMAPNDVRAYRFRGHRYISTRTFNLAIKDLERALSLAPSSFDVVYHLGLAYILTARFPEAAKAYRACLDRKTPGPALPDGWRDCAALSSSASPDPARPGAAPAVAQAPDNESRIGISDWLYRSLRRAGRTEEAKALLAGISEGLAVKENEAYYRALLFYKGVRTEAQVLPDEAFKENTGVTVGYGLANYYLAEGQTAKACALMHRLVEDEAHWNAFGFIGAEAELTRTDGPCVAQSKQPEPRRGPRD
jgi:tetratricopeptide (TPR) repeat protein